MKKIKLILLALTILSAKFYAQVPSYVPTNGLVGWWPFNGNANDLSGNGLNQSVYGAQLAMDRFNNSSQAYNFNGSNDYMERSNVSILNAIEDSITVASWIFLQNAPTAIEGGAIVARRDFIGNPNGERNHFQFSVTGNRELCFSFNNNTNSSLYEGLVTTPQNSIPTGVWSHVVATFKLGIVKLYINGNLITSLDLGNKKLPTWNHWLNFGRIHRTSGTTFFAEFPGRLDDIGIWNRALTQSEITALYTNTPPPTFSIQANGCPNVSYQPTNFTPNAGSTYQWTITPSTGAQNSTGLNTANPTFIFNSGGTYSITVQETNNGNTLTSTSASISILNLTNITPSVDGSFLQVINGVNTFAICSGPNTTSAIVYNENWGMMNPPNTSYSYTVNNGAQTPITTSATVPITYGNNNFTLTATSGVCALTNTINIYSGANPYVWLGASNTINLCPGSTVNFVIDPTPITGVNNSPGTTYSVVFIDNLASTVNMSNLINDTIIPHQYNVTSCGMTYLGNLYPANTFIAQAIAQNACGTTQSSYSPITVHNSTTASFTVSDSTICAGQTITVTNTGSAGSMVGPSAPYNCLSQGKFYWTITGGTLGTNFTIPAGQQLGSFSPAWANPTSNGSGTLNVTFLTAGTYTITQHYYNACGTKTFIRNIQVGGIPYVSLGANNTISLCPGSIVNFVIDPTQSAGVNNSPGTTYSMVFSDNPASTVNMSNLINDTIIPHQYNVTSCGVSNIGTPFPNNTYYAVVTAQNPCGTTQSSYSPITVHNSTTASFTVSDSTICAGQTITVTNTGSAGSIVGTNSPYNCTTQGKFYWTISGGSLGIDFTLASGQTLGSYCAPPNCSWANPTSNGSGTLNVTFLSAGTYTITQHYYNSCGTKTFIRNIQVGGITAGANQSVCLGNSVTLTASGGSNYTWSGGIQNGVPFTPTSTQTYTVTGTATGGCPNTSSATVTVNSVPSANAGNDFTITCSLNPNGSSIGMVNTAGNTYSWTPITGLSSASVANPTANPSTSTTYSLLVTNANGCTANDQVVVTVNNTPPTISTQPLSSQSICVGGIASTLTVAVSGGTGAPTYQWYTVNGSTSTPIPGATNSSYTPPVFATAGTFNYTVMVSQATNGCNTSSQNAQIIVIPDPVLTAPLSASYCQNGFATPLNVTVSGGINTSYSYQWYVNTNNSNVGGTIIAGANSSTYTPPTSMIGTYFYYCIVTNNPTSTGCSNSSPVAQIVIVSSPAFISQPQSNQSTCAGGILNALNVAYTGGTGTATFQWYSNTTNLNSGGTAIPGATSATYLPQSNSAGTVYYYCVISFFSMGSCQAITSNISTVTVLSSTTVNPVLDQTLCAGTQTSPINFTGTAGATYTWTNSNTTIGLASSGTGNISSFIAQNNSSIPTTATIVVTPSVTTGNQTCVGTPEIFTITVHPIPVLFSNNDITICCLANPTLMLSANLPSIFNWTASSSSPLMTGFPSGINNSNFISFTPINNSNVTETITISIEPTSLEGCIGQVETININVLPCNVSINQISNVNLCNDAVFNGITFTGTATQVQWINSNPNNGLQFSGMGNIPSIPIVNNGLNAILSQITVYPEYTWNSMSCIGNSMTFEFNIYPTPAVNAGTDQNICVGDLVTLTGSGAHTYLWNNGVTNGVPFAPINSANYIVTGTDVNGCVNSDTIQINVNTPSSSSVSINSCDSYTLNGQTYTSSGIYSQIIPNAAGCDSTITLDLTLNYSPSTPIVTIQNEVNLSTSNNTGVTYQWIQCSDLTAITGQTNSSFNPTANGLYAVIVSNSCGSDTSDCANVSTIGFNDLISNEIKLYPNPNDGQFYLEVPEQLTNQQIEIFDLNGRLIFTQELNATLNLIQTDKLASGSYLLQLVSKTPIYFYVN